MTRIHIPVSHFSAGFLSFLKGISCSGFPLFRRNAKTSISIIELSMFFSFRFSSFRTKNNTKAEKGILKRPTYAVGLTLAEHNKEKWNDDANGDNLELIAQQVDVNTGSGISDVERTLKSLNGYHEDILEALRNAASVRGTGAGNTPSGSGSISEELLRKTLQECGGSGTLNYGEYRRGGSKSSSKENICDNMQPHSVLIENGSAASMMHSQHRQHSLHQQQGDDDDTPTAGPLRIRNLEDLIRQLEHHSSRHMSPSGSEDIRMSETEADRHYRLDSSAACSESSQG